MRRSIFWGTFGGYIAVGLLTVLLFAFYTLSTLRERSAASLSHRLESTARAAAVGIRWLTVPGRRRELDARIRELGRQTGLRFTVINSLGNVLADSAADPAVMDNHRFRPEVSRALGGGMGVAQRFSSTIKRRLIYVAVPLAIPGETKGAMRVAARGEEKYSLLGRSASNLVTFSAALFMACLLAAFLYSRSILGPLRDLLATVRRFGGGDFGARLHLRRHDEFRELAESFNSLGERLQQLFREATQRSEELERIFASVQQGICLLDGLDRILRCNRGFEILVGGRAAAGQTLEEVVLAPWLSKVIAEARASGERRSQEAAIGERQMIASAEPMAGGEELILVLQDTTDIRRLDDVKRDFVANASHELRTPLTSIKGFLEMLEGKLAGQEARWLAAVRRNTERMAAIVEDLLSLSRLEAPGAQISREPTDLRPILLEVSGQFTGPARDKGLELEISVPDDLPRLPADPILLEQLLVNLLDNSVKYTEHGAIRVACSAVAGQLRIEVGDTGIGIPAEHLPRIFERFYVAHKSRSRKLGGTGLGLAIVKHIVQRLGGHVEVHSTVGEGTAFLVSLPVAAN